jgi:hypothetical protein
VDRPPSRHDTGKNKLKATKFGARPVATDRQRIDLAWAGPEMAPAGLVPLIRHTGLAVAELLALLRGVTVRVTVTWGLYL